MIFMECTPGFRRRFATADHVFGDSGLRHFDTRFQQSPWDTRCAPGFSSIAHRPDQVLNLFYGIGFSRATLSVLPCPIKRDPFRCQASRVSGFDQIFSRIGCSHYSIQSSRFLTVIMKTDIGMPGN